MKEFDRLVKTLMQSLQAFSQLVEAVRENLEKNLLSAEATKPAKPVKAARPARRETKPAKPAKVEKHQKHAKRGRPARRAPAVKATERPVEPEKPVVKLRKKRAVTEGAGVIDTIMKVIENNPAGIGTSTLKEKTGFDDRQIQNSVYRLKKLGKITAMGKGLYVPSVISEPVGEEPEVIREEVEAEA